MKLQMIYVMFVSLLLHQVIIASHSDQVTISRREYNRLFAQFEKQRDEFAQQMRIKKLQIEALELDLAKAGRKISKLKVAVEQERAQNAKLEQLLTTTRFEQMQQLSENVMNLPDGQFLEEAQLRSAYTKLQQHCKSLENDLDLYISQWEESQQLALSLRLEIGKMKKEKEERDIAYGLLLAGEMDYQSRIQQLESQLAELQSSKQLDTN